MSKSHRPPDRAPPAREPRNPEHRPGEPIRQEEGAELGEVWARGNQAASERIDPQVTEVSEIEAIAAHTTNALRFPQRDSALTERLVSLVERSALPLERREVVALRLRTDQATADEVSAAIVARMGADNDSIRATLRVAFEQALLALSGGGRAGDARDPVAEFAAAVEAVEPTLPQETVSALVRDLVLLVAFGWDEDEEFPAPGDYAAEESGW